MSKNSNLSKAKNTKNDEFYTQYNDIEKEIQAYLDYDPSVFQGKTILLPCDDPDWSNFTKYFTKNFEKFGLKMLISTSYAKDKSVKQGKIFVLDKDSNQDGKVDIEDLQWQYLEGTGDFRTDEIKALRDEADIIITNPPFSLFREFLAWIVEAKNKKQFTIIGSMNVITYKDVFPLIKDNEMWLGNGFHAGNAFFAIPIEKQYASGVFDEATGLVKFRNCCWFTNIDHGRRHQPLQLMTMADNLKFNKKIKDKNAYQKYDNYDAIEVPVTLAIPSDYKSIMGIPISFLDKYSPEQFEILGATQRGCHDEVPDTKKYDDYWEMRQSGEKTGSKGGKTNENANLEMNDGKKIILLMPKVMSFNQHINEYLFAMSTPKSHKETHANHTQYLYRC